MIDSMRGGRMGVVELLDSFISMSEVSEGFPSPMVAFWIAFPSDEVAESSLTQLCVHNFVDLVFFIVVNDFGCGL